MKTLISIWLSSMTLLFGCAGYPAPTEKMATSEAAIRAAQEMDANAHPQAALHLKLAEEQLEHAKALMAEDENQEAEMMLARSSADAELSLALAREHGAELKAQQAQQEINEFRQEQQR